MVISSLTEESINIDIEWHCQKCSQVLKIVIMPSPKVRVGRYYAFAPERAKTKTNKEKEHKCLTHYLPQT